MVEDLVVVIEEFREFQEEAPRLLHRHENIETIVF